MLARLPSHHQHLLAHHAAKFARARQCIQCNHFFIMSMLAAFDLDPDNQLQPPPPHLAAPKAAAAADAAAEALLRPEVQPTASDVEKVGACTSAVCCRDRRPALAPCTCAPAGALRAQEPCARLVSGVRGGAGAVVWADHH